jgi:ubiquinone/menaquinone biosynthesis C-methylase UbiE
LFASEFDKTRYSVWRGVKEFLDHLSPYSIVADVGCGNGKNARYRNDLVMFCSDISSELVKISKNKNTCVGSFVIANGLKLPYRSDSCDASMSIAVLHHLHSVEERLAFIKEMIRVTKPGGKVFITVWSAEQTVKPKWCHIRDTDYIVPWTSRDGNVHERFYHLFTKIELDNIMTVIDDYVEPNAFISHELDNWYLLMTKKTW